MANRPTKTKIRVYRNLNSSINWRNFTLGYIRASYACANAYLNHNPDVGGFGSYGKFSFIPAFWNFKHALELGIKFLFAAHRRNTVWGHNLISNLKKFKNELDLSDKECRELEVMCKKYCDLHPLRELTARGGKPFPYIKDFENQFFHYPEGKDSAHKAVFIKNRNFPYHSFVTSLGYNNESKMRKIMKELKKDTRLFSRILANHL